jgi:hypothetical protein
MVNDSDHATAALGRLAGALGEDAVFVLASGARDLADALGGVLERRGPAYTAAVQGRPLVRMTSHFDAWVVEMTRVMAPIHPPDAMPMMEVVREKITLEIGARGLRSLFSSKPSERDVARVKRYGALAVRVLRSVLAADGPLDEEERMTIAATIAALGLPDPEANALHSEAPHPPETLEVYGETEPAVVHAIVRGAWLAAARDGLDPREERVVGEVARKLGVPDQDSEGARRDAIARVDARRRVGAAAVDAVRYLLSDRVPGAGVQLAALTGALAIPRRFRDEALAPVGQGAPVALAKRHAGLEADERVAVLGLAWAAGLAGDPGLSRRALLRARWERLAADLEEDDPRAREDVERWMGDALVGVARTLS